MWRWRWAAARRDISSVAEMSKRRGTGARRRSPPSFVVCIQAALNGAAVDEQPRMGLSRGGNVPFAVNAAMDGVIGKAEPRCPRA